MTLDKEKSLRNKYLQNAYLPLGLMGFAITTVLLSLYNLRIFSTAASPVTEAWAIVFISVCALVLGGSIQFIAGLRTIHYGHQKTGSILATFGGFWLIYGTFQLLLNLAPLDGTTLAGKNPAAGVPAHAPNFIRAIVAVFLFLYGVICIVSLYISMHKNIITSLIFFTLIVAFFTLGIGDAIAGSGAATQTAFRAKLRAANAFQVIGGVFGLAAGFSAFYLAWAVILVNIFKKPILPFGKPILKPRDASVQLGD
ncbi:succinate-acetate transporter protein [Mycoplasmoides fastidiosum]|uniref:Succinate-acetate transporter protein n=1 Tax=Mycoplasmoides fastidiosum TaxID=92758 RepID=A0ABU0LYW6_9BACT|nr:GPR1/FUN34/YaaH family transporter [Mycoplasmoides fastidiosum]MDQ0513888.1 succinate-acetate transporter protein [Mycoplasmoides fastidiosum]UUD37698.1 GPR1/FUN34/YaaH family transporter [Mycoplasmoides fastidiosum]